MSGFTEPPHTPSPKTNPLIGIIEGFKIVGVWARNNIVYFINIIWKIIAYILHYTFKTLVKIWDRILSFLEHSDSVISATLLISASIMLTDYTIKLSKSEYEYLQNSNLSNLLDSMLYFLVIILTSILIKIAINFDYKNFNKTFVSNFNRETFTSMIKAPLKIAAYYCGAGWVLFLISLIFLKAFSKNFIPHFNRIGVYTYSATIILIVVVIVVSYVTKNSEASTNSKS